MDERTSLDQLSNSTSPSSSEEDSGIEDYGNNIGPSVAGTNMVHRTSKRESSIPYSWLEQRNTGTRNIIDTEELETPTRKDMLFPNGPKAGKGRRYIRRIMRALKLSETAIDMILYGQRFSTQKRYYYAIEKLRNWATINHFTILDLLTIKPHIIITEVLAQFTSSNTSASSALQLLNGLSSMLSLIFNVDLKNNIMLQMTRKAIASHMIVRTKYEDTWNVGILFDYRRQREPNNELSNVEL
jgi:hypothetical protein